jgi:hypothetical protein
LKKGRVATYALLCAVWWGLFGGLETAQAASPKGEDCVLTSAHWDAIQAELKRLREQIASLEALGDAARKGGDAAGAAPAPDDKEIAKLREELSQLGEKVSQLADEVGRLSKDKGGDAAGAAAPADDKELRDLLAQLRNDLDALVQRVQTLGGAAAGAAPPPENTEDTKDGDGDAPPSNPEEEDAAEALARLMHPVTGWHWDVGVSVEGRFFHGSSVHLLPIGAEGFGRFIWPNSVFGLELGATLGGAPRFHPGCPTYGVFFSRLHLFGVLQWWDGGLVIGPELSVFSPVPGQEWAVSLGVRVGGQVDFHLGGERGGKISLRATIGYEGLTTIPEHGILVIQLGIFYGE